MNECKTRGRGVAEDVSSGRVGERVRGLRRGRGWTLEVLAERSGVSRAMISKLERGEKERREVVVVPRDRRMVMRDPETGFERQLLSGGRGLEFIKNVVPEGSTAGEFPPHRRGVEEYLLVEKGRLRVILGGEEYVLDEGDSAYFEADVTHRFDNVGEGECSYYVVIDPGDR
jgi:mannose-6-phosphate isomerase-like protein (cupin superfamily)